MSDTNDFFAPTDEYGDTARSCERHPNYIVTIDSDCPICRYEEDGHTEEDYIRDCQVADHLFVEQTGRHLLEPVEGREGIDRCRICGCAEGTLPTHCPGKQVDSFAQEEIYNGTLDYIDGEWLEVVVI